MKTNSATSHFSLLAAHVLALVGLAFFCGRLSASLPQLASGSDALSVAFGDAREVISRAAVHKADSYFHGGIEMECNDHSRSPREVARDTCGDCEDHDCAHSAIHHSFSDPWSWINSRVRAPQEHHHLEGSKAVELMPWFWVAVRTDPHNAEAWAEAWYAAAHVMKDSELAARVLAEAKVKNPDSIEIAFTEGRALYDGGRGDLAAAVKAFERTRALGDAKCGGDVSKLTEREEESYRFAGNYLKSLKEKSR